MEAMLNHGVEDLSRNHSPLTLTDISQPTPKKGELLIKIPVYVIFPTDLDEIERRTPPESYPVVPGHQVVGIVEDMGYDVDQVLKGDQIPNSRRVKDIVFFLSFNNDSNSFRVLIISTIIVGTKIPCLPVF